MNDFTIAKVGWQTEVKRNYEFNNEIVYSYFESIIFFLQENNLTTRILLEKNEKATNETVIKFSDLTPIGFELVKRKFDKWAEAIVDKGKPVNDMTVFIKELSKIKTKISK